MLAVFADKRSLVFDLGLYYLLPQLLLYRLLRLDLFAEALCLNAVALDGQEHPRRMMVAAAKDDRRTAIEKLR